MYLVFCETTEGYGCYFGGIYRSYDRALARMKWCQNHCLYGNDGWRIAFVKAQPTKGGYYSDKGESKIEPGEFGEYGDEPEGE